MRLTTNERLSLALMAMDEDARTVYADLVSYCQETGTRPDQICSRDLLQMLYRLIDGLPSAGVPPESRIREMMRERGGDG